MTFMYQVYALFGISDNYTSLRWKEQTSSSCSNVIFIIIIIIIFIIIFIIIISIIIFISIIIRNETTGKLRSPWKIHAQLMKRVRMRKETIGDLLVLIKQEGEVEKLCKNDTTLHEYLRKKVQAPLIDQCSFCAQPHRFENNKVLENGLPPKLLRFWAIVNQLVNPMHCTMWLSMHSIRDFKSFEK